MLHYAIVLFIVVVCVCSTFSLLKMIYKWLQDLWKR